MSEALLPLFPLKVVLFPRTEIPLHIFEERYKEMIGGCLQDGSEFGVVLVLEEGLASIGCTAGILELIRKFEDGRMDILVRGRRRFELSGLDQEKSFLRGAATFFVDDEDPPPVGDSRRKRAMALYQGMAQERSAEKSAPPSSPPELNDPELSFQIASRLPVDLAFRQTLMQMRSEGERLERTTSYLEKMSTRLRRVARAQPRAAVNGRSH